MSLCLCGSLQDYSICCGAFIEQKKLPATPEELMRSRYTAYATSQIDYIAKTMQGPAAHQFNASDAFNWSKSVNWLRLKVIDTKITHNKGWVEFIASYSINEIEQHIHEVSEFHLIAGIWYYVDGKKPTSRKVKVGRNDPCPCGSKRKYKVCCS